MSRKTRFMLEQIELFELTSRTIQGRYLLRPSPELNEIIEGLLARACRIYGVRVVATAVMSNHFHILIASCTTQQVADFMRYFKSNLAREAGRLYGWTGPFWDRRYEIAPVENDPKDQIRRLRYVLEQGCKESLVWTPREWPGFTTLRAALTGKPLRGVWLNRTEMFRSQRRGEDRPESSFHEHETCSLAPLPCWKHLSAKEHQRRIAEIVRDIEDDTRRRHTEQRSEPLGRARILSQEPQERPNKVKRSPAPWIHAHSKKARAAYRRAYAWYLAAYREASRRFREGELNVEFPPGCFPPRLLAIPPRAPT